MKKVIILTIAAAMLAFLSVSVVKAAEPNVPKSEPISVIGTVTVAKDAAGKITAIHLSNIKKGTFSIVLDKKGKELGRKMNGKMVKVTGMETIKGTEKWLTVEKYSEVKKAKEKGKQSKRR
jgi:hypothetical protein